MKKIISAGMLVLLGLLLVACGEDTSNIERVHELEAISVPQFTSFDDLGLPENIDVTLSDGSQVSIPVAWDRARGRYVPNQVGTVTLTGDLITSGDITNRQELSVGLEVHVLAEDIMATLYASGRFNTLISLLESTGFDDALNEMPSLTLFAPNDDAFDAILDTLGLTKSALYDAPWIDDFLQYHVIAERQHTQSALEGFAPMSLPTLQGESIQFDQADPYLRLNGMVSMTGYELTTSQGMIHEIDAVLLPSAMLSEIGSEFLFDDLQALLFELILSGDIPLDLLPNFGSGDFTDIGLTIFAPSEEALRTLADEMDLSLETLLASETFIDVLLYHVVLDDYLASELYEQAPLDLTTVQGETLSVSIVEDALQIQGASITSSESLVMFGTMHMIDRVLIPPSLKDAWPSQSE